MDWKKGVVWVVFGLALSFTQAFFISRWLVGLWVIILSWREEEPWWPILAVGTFDDILLLEPVGKGVIFYLVLSLITKWLKRFLGLGKNVRVKVGGF